MRFGRTTPFGLLLWLIAVVFWLVWTPWDSVHSRIELGLPTHSLEIAINLVLLAPIAIILAAGSRETRRLPVVLKVAAVVLAISVLIELGQTLWFELGRTGSPYDIALNVAGAALAAWVTAELRRAGWPAKRIVLTTAGLVFVAVSVYLVNTAVANAGQFRLANWQEDFQVVSGNELGGGRAYEGAVSDAEICAGESFREVCAAAGADRETRRALVESAERSNRVRVTARVRSATADQRGPARILTFSAGTILRNLTLGQTATSLVLRVRTAGRPPNGNWLEFVLPDAVQVDTPTRITAAFDRGVARLSARSEVGERVGIYPTGLLSGWWYLRPRFEVARFESVHVVAASLAGAIVLFVPLGMMVAWRGRPPFWAALLFVILLGPLVLLAVDWAIARKPASLEIVFAAVLSLLGLLLGRSDRRRLGELEQFGG